MQLRSRTKATDVRELEREAEQLTRDKDQAVAAEQYERASALRDRINAVTRRIKAEEAGRPGDGRIIEVTAEDIAEVVSRQTGIPASSLTQEDKTRLLGLEEHLHARVVGQDEAVKAVSEAVMRSRGASPIPAVRSGVSFSSGRPVWARRNWPVLSPRHCSAAKTAWYDSI